MARIAKFFPALLSALLTLMAFPPYGWAPLVFVALVPWLMHVRTQSPKGAFATGYALGFVIVLAQMAWTRSLTLQWTGSVALSFAPWLVCAFLGGFYFAFLGSAARRCMRSGAYWKLPILWAGMEAIRSYIPGLAFPWFLMGTPLAQYPLLIQPAFLGTAYLVTAWVVSMNLLTVRLLDIDRWPKIRPYALLVAAYLLFSLVHYYSASPGRTVRVAIGQPAVDMAFGDPTLRDMQLNSAITRITELAKQSEASLLVLPEGLAREGSHFPPTVPFPIEPDLPVLFGGRRGTGPTYQSAFAYDGTWNYSDKTRLVVFGEYVPGRGILPFLDQFNLAGSDLTPGEKVATIRVADITVGPLICFEGLFYDVSHQQAMSGAQLLAVMSIDDWYRGTAAPEQLAAATAFRAVETGLPVVRSASMGISLAVDARGREIERAPEAVTTMLPIDVSVPDEAPRIFWRPLFPWIAGLSWVLFLLGTFGLRRTERR